MQKSNFNDLVFDEDDIIKALYSGKAFRLSDLKVKNKSLIKRFNTSVTKNADNLELLKEYIETEITEEQYHLINQNNWFIPDEYKELDISSWLLNKCFTEVEILRVQEELKLFEKNNMIDILKTLKYLVDFMRSNDILWGVGRGSSVSSYCLYLIGVHKIDSIKYKLDITEFIKES